MRICLSPSSSRSTTLRKRAADEALYLVGAAGLTAPRRFPAHPLGRRARKQGVLGRHPAATGAPHPTRDVLVDRGCAEHLRAAVDGEHGAGSELGEISDEHARAELVEGPPVMAFEIDVVTLSVGHSGRVAAQSRERRQK